MRQIGWLGLLVLLGASLWAQDGPRTNAANLPVRTDANGYVLVAEQTYTGPDGPRRVFANTLVRTDASGYLIVTNPTPFGGGTYAPIGAQYIVSTLDSDLTAEESIGALTTGLLLNTVAGADGTLSAYGGTSCTNQFPRSLNASGAATCASVALGSDVTGQLPASAVDFARIAGSTFVTGQDVQNIFHSAGWTTGGIISDAGGETFDVAAGTGLIRATDSATAEIVFFDWPASTGNAIPTDAVRYVGIEYNAGSPQVVVKTSYSWDLQTEFPLGNVVNDNTALHLENAPHAVGDHATNMVRRSFETMPSRRDNREGGLILGETGTRNITLSSGALWERLTRFSISAIDTSSSGSFDRYYQDGMGGWTLEAANTAWNNTQYDDGDGGLATITNNRYSVQYFYLELDGNLVSLYGQAQYVTLAQAQNDSPPSTVPERITAQAILNGRVVFQESGSTAEAVETIYTTTFSLQGVTDHGNLAGLGDDDHTQYLLVAGTRALSGDWDAGSFEVRAQTLESDVATGTAPFVIASTTLVSNLNADLLDGQEASEFPDISGTPANNQIALWVDADTLEGDTNFLWDGTDFTIDGTPTVFVNDTSCTDITIGVCINSAAADDDGFVLKSSDVGHPMTGIREADVYYTIRKSDPTAGGAALTGMKDADGAAGGAILFQAALGEAVDDTKSTVGVAVVHIDAFVTDGGTSVTAPAADGNLLVIRSGGTTRFIFDADGDSHQDVGTAWTNFDAFDDAEVLDQLSYHVSAPTDPIRARFAAIVDESRDALEEMELVTFNDDGHHFVNMSRLTMLLTGAARQASNERDIMASELERTQADLRAVTIQLARLLDLYEGQEPRRVRASVEP